MVCQGVSECVCDCCVIKQHQCACWFNGMLVCWYVGMFGMLVCWLLDYLVCYNMTVSNSLGLLWSSRAATPGSTLPSNSSREAPPPVEMCDIWLATPAFSTADTESPPPMMVVHPYNHQSSLNGTRLAQWEHTHIPSCLHSQTYWSLPEHLHSMVAEPAVSECYLSSSVGFVRNVS